VGRSLTLIAAQLFALVLNTGAAVGAYTLIQLPAVYFADNDLLRVTAELSVFLAGGFFAVEAGTLHVKYLYNADDGQTEAKAKILVSPDIAKTWWLARRMRPVFTGALVHWFTMSKQSWRWCHGPALRRRRAPSSSAPSSPPPPSSAGCIVRTQ